MFEVADAKSKLVVLSLQRSAQSNGIRRFDLVGYSSMKDIRKCR